MIRKLAKFIFFGNYFLGFCIAALSYETLVQCGFQHISYIYLALVFFATVVYYTYAYTTKLNYYEGNNTRLRWYVTNKCIIKITQAVFVSLIAAIGCLLVYKNQDLFIVLSFLQWLLLLMIPALALLYYGIVLKPGFTFSIRRYGWLKPFVIGLVAAGTVTVYPLILSTQNEHTTGFLSTEKLLFFIANFMFASVVAIMFDIKDFAADNNQQLKTFVVNFGFKKTIYYLLFPLIFLGLIACLAFCFFKNFSAIQALFNGLPFTLLSIAAWSLQRRKKILYYLAVIDGLLLVKAICGICAAALF